LLGIEETVVVASSRVLTQLVTNLLADLLGGGSAIELYNNKKNY